MPRLLPLLLLAFLPAVASAAEFDPKPLDAIVEAAMKRFDPPGAAVVVVKGDEVIYCKGFGVRKAGTEEKVTPDTLFAIASCSKAFTATLAAMLVDEGKLNWDDKVHQHLDAFRMGDPLTDREVTIRDFLCHRSGMPRHDLLWAGGSTDQADVIRRWSRSKPSTSFRSTWEYSNVPFTTVGALGGKLAGSDWPTAMKARIFDPLKMTNTVALPSQAVKASNRATPHYFTLDNKLVPVEWDDIDHSGGAGCIASSATDLGQWLRFQLNGGKVDDERLLSEKQLNETRSPQMVVKPEGPFAFYFPAKSGTLVTYGLGWFVHDYRGHTAVSHGGTLTGFRAQTMMVPSKKLGVVVLGNRRPSYFTEAVARTILDHLLDLPDDKWNDYYAGVPKLMDFGVAVARNKRVRDRKSDTEPSLPLKDYAGQYEEAGYGTATVAFADNKLTAKWGKYTFRLDHYHFDTFTAVPVEPKDDTVSFDRSTFEVQFKLGTDGGVTGLRFLDQDFTPVKPGKK